MLFLLPLKAREDLYFGTAQNGKVDLYFGTDGVLKKNQPGRVGNQHSTISILTYPWYTYTT